MVTTKLTQIGKLGDGFTVDANGVINTTNTGSSGDITIPVLGTPAIDKLTEYINSTGFTGKISGGALTDAGSGNLNVALGAGFIRTTNSDVGALLSIEWAANPSLALTDNSINYVYVTYNAGSPVITVTTNRDDVDFTTSIALGRVYRSGTVLSIIQTGIPTGNGLWRVQDAIMQTRGFAHSSGAVLSSPSGLKIKVTDGVFYFGIIRLNTSGKDTSLTDTFTTWHRNGSGGWTQTASQTDVSALNYDDGDGTLGTVTAGRYCVHWVYISYDGSLHVQYGQVQNYTLTVAQAAQPPAAPGLLANFATLVGKVIVLRGATAINQIQSAWTVTFQGSAATNHADLTNLEYANAGHIGFQQDTSDLTAGTPASTDYVPYYDMVTSSHKKALKSEFGGGSSNGVVVIQRSFEGTVIEASLLYWVAPAACTVNSAIMALVSAPSASGTYCKVQVMKNGTLETNSIFTSDLPMQITELTSATNGIYQAAGTLDSTTLVAGDVLHFRVNQADAGSADLLVQLVVTLT